MNCPYWYKYTFSYSLMAGAWRQSGTWAEIRMQKVICILLLFSQAVLSFGTALAEQNRDIPQIHGGLETTMELKYRANEKLYKLDFPLYGSLQLLYENERINTAVSLDYIGESGIGETYLLGGTEYSYMKIGYYASDWGYGYSISPLGSLNIIDDRYPSNIFYRKNYLPHPCFTMTVGSQRFHQQTVFTNREKNIESVKDTDLGLRAIWNENGSTVSLGLIRKLGYPPPLFFLTVENLGDLGNLWIELCWEYYKTSRDIWSFVFGVKRELSSAVLCAEYVMDGAQNFIFLEEIFLFNPSAQFDLKGFFHIPDMSSAFNGSIPMSVERNLVFEPGFYLFLGKKDKYFSPLKEDNNNSIYFKLKYSF